MAAGLRQNFGRYVSRESPLHGLDPSVKVLVFVMLIACIFLSGDWYSTALSAAAVIALCALSRVGFSFYIGTLKYFAWMFALSFALNVFFPRGTGAGALSAGALNTAGIFSARLGLMVLAGAVFTVTTAPHEIGDSLLALTALRGRSGRTMADLAALLSISLRFIPVMFEEAERVSTAQRLRGQKAGGLRGRARAVVNLVAPLFQGSLRKAGDLGFALESRCYGYRVPRTAGPRLGRREVAALGLLSACLSILIIRRASGL